MKLEDKTIKAVWILRNRGLTVRQQYKEIADWYTEQDLDELLEIFEQEEKENGIHCEHWSNQSE